MPERTPAQKSLLGSAAINTRWSRIPYAERAAATQAARDARWRKYLDAVPASVTDPAERAALAAQARRADLQRAAAKSARSRAAKAARKRGQA